MKLKIKPFTDHVKSMYLNHGHFHDGDAGLDVYIVEQQTLAAGETALIHLQIACEPNDNQPFLLMPRSSIAKTPLRLCNSIGLIDGGYRGEIWPRLITSKEKITPSNQIKDCFNWLQ